MQGSNELPNCHNRLRVSREDLAEALRGSVTPLQRLLLKQFLTRLDLIDSQIEQLDQALATAMEPYSDAIQRLSEIPEWDPMRQHRSVLRSGQRPGCSPH